VLELYIFKKGETNIGTQDVKVGGSQTQPLYTEYGPNIKGILETRGTVPTDLRVNLETREFMIKMAHAVDTLNSFL
jgi:hypothetical protein